MCFLKKNKSCIPRPPGTKHQSAAGMDTGGCGLQIPYEAAPDLRHNLVGPKNYITKCVFKNLC